MRRWSHETETQGEHLANMEAEIGVMLLQAREQMELPQD